MLQIPWGIVHHSEIRAHVADGSLADNPRARVDVRSTPGSGHQSHAPSCLIWAMNRRRLLFNNLISAGKERMWHSEAKRLGGLEVDHQLVFGRALHWKVVGLFALEDAIHVASSLPVLIDRVSSVRDEATFSDPGTERIDRRQSVSRRQRDDQIAIIE